MIGYRKSWGTYYIEYFDEINKIASAVPLEWTDVHGMDLFQAISKERSLFRTTELLRLVELIYDLIGRKNM